MIKAKENDEKEKSMITVERIERNYKEKEGSC